MSPTRINPEMVEGTAIIEADKAGKASGGAEGDVVQLDSSAKIATGYLDTGTVDGKLIVAEAGDKIPTSLIKTGITQDDIVQVGAGGTLPGLSGSALSDVPITYTSLLAALPDGAQLQTVVSTLKDKPFDILAEGATSGIYESEISELNVTLTPKRVGSTFKVDVSWSGGLDDYIADEGTTDEEAVPYLGFYLVGYNTSSTTTTILQGEEQEDRMRIISPVSSDWTIPPSGINLLSCSFTYTSTSTDDTLHTYFPYSADETIRFTLAARIATVGQKLWTNRSASAVNNTAHSRSISSIAVTELRGS